MECKITRINQGYLLYLNNFNYKPYLDLLESDLLRHSLTRLRTSSHRLEVEVSRCAKPERVPFEHRMCTNCNLLKDEYHFEVECQRHNDLRRNVMPNMFKFLDLIQSTNVSSENLCSLCV